MIFQLRFIPARMEKSQIFNRWRRTESLRRVFEDTEEDELPYDYDTDAGIALFLLPKFTVEGTEYSIDYLNGNDDRDDFFD